MKNRITIIFWLMSLIMNITNTILMYENKPAFIGWLLASAYNFLIFLDCIGVMDDNKKNEKMFDEVIDN